MLTKMDELGRPAWIAATLLGFWLFWPVGLAILTYLAWTGRLRSMASRAVGPGQWFNLRADASGANTGDQAFDNYRAETLRRLEEEKREFADYLERLRRARDKAEFDGFMAERRSRPGTTREPEVAEATFPA